MPLNGLLALIEEQHRKTLLKGHTRESAWHVSLIQTAGDE
jgi:hypothetical protein